MKELQSVVSEKTFEPLPDYTTKTFCNTAKTVDKNSMTLIPGDIPQGLHPARIQGDGNCLPRSASLIAYGTEDHYVEMRERIVCEMVKNEKLCLDNKYLKSGMNPNGNVDVAKTFAAYSSLYTGTRLNKTSIRKLYEQEALSICRNGTYMGLWQLANILSCPVMSVYPEYGSHTVRKDMHRVFFPAHQKYREKEPVYIMWTNCNGAMVAEKEFSVNHFVVLMPLTNTGDIDLDSLDCSFDSSVNEEDDSLNDTMIMDAIHYLDVDMSEIPGFPKMTNLGTTDKPDVVDKLASDVNDQPDPDVLDQPDLDIFDQPDPYVVDQPHQDVDDKPHPDIIHQPDPDVVNQPHPDVVDQPDPEVVDQPDPDVIDQPDPVVIDQSDPDVIDQPVPMEQAEETHKTLMPLRADPVVVDQPDTDVVDQSDPMEQAEETRKTLMTLKTSFGTSEQMGFKNSTDLSKADYPGPSEPAVGDYLLCEYRTKKKNMQYVGEVLDVSGSEPYVEFLENTRSSSLKKRKRIPERAVVDIENIVKKLKMPDTIFRGREMLLLFKDLDP